MTQRLEILELLTHVLALSDSDQGGCLRTRRSTSCVILMHGRHFLIMMCSTPSPIALSFGECEWFALTHAGCAIIGVGNLSRDLERLLSAHLKSEVTHQHPTELEPEVALDTYDTAKGYHDAPEMGNDNSADLRTTHSNQGTMWKHVQSLF